MSDELQLFLSVLTALLVFSTALIGLIALVIKVREEIKESRDVAERTDDKIDEIHVLVNDRLSKALTRIEQLSIALKSSGVHVPETPGFSNNISDNGGDD